MASEPFTEAAKAQQDAAAEYLLRMGVTWSVGVLQIVNQTGSSLF